MGALPGKIFTNFVKNLVLAKARPNLAWVKGLASSIFGQRPKMGSGPAGPRLGALGGLGVRYGADQSLSFLKGPQIAVAIVNLFN